MLLKLQASNVSRMGIASMSSIERVPDKPELPPDERLRRHLGIEIGIFMDSCRYYRKLWSTVSNSVTWGIPLLSVAAAFAAKESYVNTAALLSSMVAAFGLLAPDFQRRWISYRDAYTATQILEMDALTEPPGEVKKRLSAIFVEHNKAFRPAGKK